MLKLLIITALSGILLAASPVAWSYDTEMARSYAKLFSDVAGPGAGKALHFVSPEDFIESMKQGKDYVAIDIRTPAETDLFTLTLPGSMAIPADQIFIPANLERIPGDKPVMIVCKSGARATAIGTALRHTGFDNVYILKGGFQALASYHGPKQAHTDPAAAGK